MPLSAAQTAGLRHRFGVSMARLAPFEPVPALAVAVSGGADSMALALLARDWAHGQGGSLLAIVVDHGLRPGSAAEAALTVARLNGRGIPAHKIRLNELPRGPSLAARARTARYAALETACAERGILHLLLGHHAGDQAETLRMRAAAGSGGRGLACMAALVERPAVRLLRPLLAEPPGLLRALLRADGLDWVEDPSNHDLATLRARLRHDINDPAGDGAVVTGLCDDARGHGIARAEADREIARELAARVRLHPAGWAVLTAGALSVGALSALLCTIAGRRYPAASDAVARLAAAPRAATLAGVRLLPAGRAGRPGDWLVVREAAAMQAPVVARPLAMWDGRFRLAPSLRPEPGTTLGALGDDAAGWRRATDWPSVVLCTLPALRRDGQVVAVPVLVPVLGGAGVAIIDRLGVAFRPAMGLTTAPFLPI